MAELTQAMHVTMTCDTTEIEAAILKLKAGLDIRTKCALRDCPKQGLERNRVLASLDTAGPPIVVLHLCDAHFEEYNYLNEENG